MAYSADQLALQAHLIAQREEAIAWQKAEEGRFVTYYTTDLDHWAQQGVFSVADLERQDLESYISDAHKDAYGFRARYNFSDMSMAQLEAEADRLSDAVAEQIAESDRAKEQAVVKFNKLVDETIEMGAGDRETAIRWILDGVDPEGERDLDYACYMLGLPYRFFEQEQAA